MIALFFIVAAGVALMVSGRAYGYVKGEGTLIDLLPIGNGERLRVDAAKAFLAMQREAADVGITIIAESGFRFMAEQIELYNLYLQGKGNLAARPGYSGHQSGTDVDIKVGGSFTSPEYRWLEANAHRFGFYNTGKTFSQPEPWHWSYRV